MDDWRKEAACRGADTNLWYQDRPEEGGIDYSTARAICRTCPVTVECLAYAVDNSEKHGMWGGRSPRERRGDWRKRPLNCGICGRLFAPQNRWSRYCGAACRGEADRRKWRAYKQRKAS